MSLAEITGMVVLVVGWVGLAWAPAIMLFDGEYPSRRGLAAGYRPGFVAIASFVVQAVLGRATGQGDLVALHAKGLLWIVAASMPCALIYTWRTRKIRRAARQIRETSTPGGAAGSESTSADSRDEEPH